MKLDVQVILLGTGMPEYHEFFENMSARYPQKFAAVLVFNDMLSHLIEAGSDIFLMPSMYEPCGLNQLYSLRYGTIPVVRSTGGLKDTVSLATQSSIESGRGTGFRFDKYNSETMLKTVKSALKLYNQKPELWRILVKNAMTKDYSWSASALKYVRLYKMLKMQKDSDSSH
jgi:starch synthase